MADDKFHLFDLKTAHVEPTTAHLESTNVSLLGVSKPGSFGSNNSFLKMDSILNSVKPQKQNDSGNFGSGFIKGMGSAVGGLVVAPMAMLAHPVQTINGVANLGSLALQPSKAYEEVKGYVHKLGTTGGEKGGEMWGSLAVNAFFAGEATAGLYKAGKGLLGRGAAAEIGDSVVGRSTMLRSATEAPVARAGTAAAVSPTDRLFANADETLRASAKPATDATQSFMQELEHKPGAFTVPHNADLPAGTANLHITDGVAQPPIIAETPRVPLTHVTVNEPMVQMPKPAELPGQPFTDTAAGVSRESLLGRLNRPTEGAPMLAGSDTAKLGGEAPRLDTQPLRLDTQPPIAQTETPRLDTQAPKLEIPRAAADTPHVTDARPQIGADRPSIGQQAPHDVAAAGQTAPFEAKTLTDQVPLDRQPVRAAAGAEPKITIGQPAEDFSVPRNAADARPGQTFNFNPATDVKAPDAGVHINTTEVPLLAGKEPLPPRMVQTEVPSLSPAQERVLQTTQTDVSKQLDALRSHAGATPEITAKIDAAQTELKNVAKNPSATNIQKLDQSLADLQKTASHDTQLANTVGDLRTTTINDVQTAVRPAVIQPATLFDNVAVSGKLETVSKDVTARIDNLKSLTNDETFIKRADAVQSDWQKLTADPSAANYLEYQRSVNDLVKSAGGDARLVQPALELDKTTMSAWRDALPQTGALDRIDLARVADKTASDLTSQLDRAEKLNAGDSQIANQFTQVRSDLNEYLRNPSDANYMQMQTRLNDLQAATAGDAQISKAVSEFRSSTIGANQAVVEAKTLEVIRPIDATTATKLDAQVSQMETMGANNTEFSNKLADVRTSVDEYVRNPQPRNFADMQAKLDDLQKTTVGDAQLSKAVSDFKSSTTEVQKSVVSETRVTARDTAPTIGEPAARDLNSKVDSLEQMATGNSEFTTKVSDVRTSLNEYVRNPSEGNFVDMQNKLNDLKTATAGDAQLSKAVADLKTATTETATKSIADSAAARTGDAVQSNISSLKEKMPEQSPAIDRIQESYDRAAADPSPANLRDLKNNVDNLEASTPDAQRAIVQNDINALRQSSVGELSAAGAEQSTLRAAAARSEAATQIGSIEAKTGKIGQFETEYNAAAEKVSTARTEAQFSQAATELDQKLSSWENKLYSDLRDGSLTRAEVQTVRANTNEFISNQEKAILARSSADTGMLYRDGIVPDSAAASDATTGGIRANTQETLSPAASVETAPRTTAGVVNDGGPRTPAGNVSDTAPRTAAANVGEPAPRVGETSTPVVAADAGRSSSALTADTSKGPALAAESRLPGRAVDSTVVPNEGIVSTTARDTSAVVNGGAASTLDNISNESRLAAAGDSRIAGNLSSDAKFGAAGDSRIAASVRATDSAAGFSTASRIEQVTGRTADEVFGTGARGIEVQASTDANRMFVPQTPADFVAASQRFESSAEAYNSMVRDSAPAANLTSAQVSQLSIDTQGTLQLARQQFVNNAWEAASASRGSLVSATDNLLKSSNLPPAMASQLDAYVQKIDSLASRYTSAQTDFAQKSAATAIREQLDQLQTQISKAGVVPPAAVQQQVTQAVSDFMQNGSIREARAIANGSTVSEHSMLGTINDGMRSSVHLAKKVLANPWVQGYAGAAVVSHAINDAGESAKQEEQSKQAATSATQNSAAPASAQQETRQRDTSNGGNANGTSSDRTVNGVKDAEAPQQKAAASQDNAENNQQVAQQSANFDPSDNNTNAVAVASSRTSEPTDQTTIARPSSPEGTMSQLQSASFGSLTSDKAKVLFSMLYSGGQTVAFDVNYRGPGVQQAEAEARPILFSQPRLNVRTDITETQERPTNKSFDWRKTQLSTASLGRRDGHYISNPYADPHSKSLKSTTVSVNQGSTAGGVAQQYPFLMVPKTGTTQPRNVAVAPGAENSERNNPDAISTGQGNDPHMQAAAGSGTTQNDPNTANDEQPQVVASV